MYLHYLSNNLSNPFWVSVVKATLEFHTSYYREHPPSSLKDQPLWYNLKITIQSVKNWDNRDVKVVRDVLDENNFVKSKEDLGSDVGFKINVMDYAALIRSLAREEIASLETPSSLSPWCQEFKLNKDNNPTPTAIDSWQREVTDTAGGNQWCDLYIILHRTIRDVNTKMFQYKIIHRILAINEKN